MSNLSAALLIYALGIVISLLVALVIKGIVVATGLLARPAAATPDEPVAAAEAIPAGHLVAIAAAVHTLLGAGQRIVHIEDAGRSRVWTASSRAAHYASHRPRHPH